MKIAVFISGRGSNLEAILNSPYGKHITHVISDKKNIAGFEVAQSHGITHTYINWRIKSRAEQFAEQLLNEELVDLIVLAGFMKILSASFVSAFSQKIINIHPSLLPDYPGLNTHQRVLDDKKPKHGATVHLVDHQLDGGQSLAQISMNVSHDDTAESLAAKLILKEHKLLVYVIGLIIDGTLKWDAHSIIFNNQVQEKPIQLT